MAWGTLVWLGETWGCLGGALGVSGRCPGSLWGCLGVTLERLGVASGLPWGPLGVLVGCLGYLGERLGGASGCVGGASGWSWGALGCLGVPHECLEAAFGSKIYENGAPVHRIKVSPHQPGSVGPRI